MPTSFTRETPDMANRTISFVPLKGSRQGVSSEPMVRSGRAGSKGGGMIEEEKNMSIFLKSP